MAHDFATDTNVRAGVRSRRVESCAREHGRGERGICAAVGGEVDLHGQQLAILVEGSAMTGARRMALGGRGQIFHAVVDHLDRVAALHGQQSGVGGEGGRIVLFAAEGSAGLGLDDAHFPVGQVEDLDERLVHVVRTLQRAPHGDAVFCAPLGDDAVVLDVEMLLRAGAILAFNDIRGELPKRRRRRLFQGGSF